jgi:hypothetical protein
MKKIMMVLDFIFALWLLLASWFAVWNGGNGVHAWPLLILAAVMLLIAYVRVTAKLSNNMQIAVCYLIVASLSGYSILFEYLHTDNFDVGRYPEILLVIFLAIGLLVFNLYCWFSDRRQRSR